MTEKGLEQLDSSEELRTAMEEAFKNLSNLQRRHSDAMRACGDDKEKLLDTIRANKADIEEAMRQYQLSLDEFVGLLEK
ncbi:hypothetical protein H6775_02030 [Candidatus Nomurabacteria bacterium]|nr:hypothetical protein [Candidatus Nomurabacteria bacterium]